MRLLKIVATISAIPALALCFGLAQAGEQARISECEQVNLAGTDITLKGEQVQVLKVFGRKIALYDLAGEKLDKAINAKSLATKDDHLFLAEKVKGMKTLLCIEYGGTPFLVDSKRLKIKARPCRTLNIAANTQTTTLATSGSDNC